MTRYPFHKTDGPMARNPGFGRVNDRGYAAFLNSLHAMPWAAITEPDPAQPLSEAPILVVLKHDLVRAVDGVLDAMGLSSKVLDADRAWGRCQMRLHARVLFDEHDPDPERRIAADRIRTVLLSGNGTAQNALRPELAVDFGRAQVAACREGAPMYADIQTLGH